jgi:hypothetical protein
LGGVGGAGGIPGGQFGFGISSSSAGSVRGGAAAGVAGGTCGTCNAWILNSVRAYGSQGSYEGAVGTGPQPAGTPMFKDCFVFVGEDDNRLAIYRSKSTGLLYYMSEVQR